jgi:phosphoenolpyruvate carboxykinase (GTP)
MIILKMDIDNSILDAENRAKIEALNNKHVEEIIERYTKLCKPAKVTVITDSEADIGYVRQLALDSGEEKKLAMGGHTIHYDGYHDQARDKPHTCVLLPKGKKLSSFITATDRDEGLKEVFEIMDGIMKGKEMLVRFFCLGPTDSEFSLYTLQLTDSAYVAHSEDLLYRQGYEGFKALDGSKDFFYFIHSAGELDEQGNTKNIDKRRIYIDLEEERVFTVNNQYAGNSLGLKKLALRLAIAKANREDWLTEHMFVMGVHPPGKDRVTYFTGAFPSACGKTSTAMVPGQTIVGDDIAYIRPSEEGVAKAVNVERGIFGIIENVNPIDDPEIYKTLMSPRELIFSNVLIRDEKPYWKGMGTELPSEGVNHSGEWFEGKKDPDGNDIPHSHKNARYTIKINDLDNADPKADSPEGVTIKGFIYGGRDSDTSPPVYQSLSWAHGVFTGASLESETTAATLGKQGVRKHNPMANLDFLVVPLGTYVRNHIRFGEELDVEPLVFATNYFLKHDGEFLNKKLDKKIWLLWMEGRVNNEYAAIETPIGFLPQYDDLRQLFSSVFGRTYTREEYEQQFSIRIDKLLTKLDRIEAIFQAEDDIPPVFYDHLNYQRTRLEEAKEKFGKDVITPFEFE